MVQYFKTFVSHAIHSNNKIHFKVSGARHERMRGAFMPSLIFFVTFFREKKVK